MTAVLAWLRGRPWLVVLAVLILAMGAEELRLAWSRAALATATAELAERQVELERSRQEVALLRADQAQAVKALDGLREQLRAERQARARAQARAEERAKILANARTIPAGQVKGGVVDDQTSVSAVAHLNGLLR